MDHEVKKLEKVTIYLATPMTSESKDIVAVSSRGQERYLSCSLYPKFQV